MLIAVGIFFLILTCNGPAFSSDEIVVKDGKPAIVKVCNGPIAFESNFKGGKCVVQYGFLPMNAVKLGKGETLLIKVFGDDDIVIECLGSDGIKIKKD